VGEDALQRILVGFRLLGLLAGLLDANQIKEPCGELSHREDEISHAGRDRCARHGRVFGLLGVLHQDDPARLLDGAHPKSAVRTGAAEHDCKTVTHPFGSGSEEQVNGSAFASRFVKLRGADLVVDHQNTAVGRNDIDAIRRQIFRSVDLCDGHARAACQNLRQLAAAIRIEMHHDHERSPRLLGECREEPLQGWYAAGGCSDRHDGRFSIARP
jgi:hypothetical protein